MSEATPPFGGMSEFEKKLMMMPEEILGADAGKHLSAAEAMLQTLKEAGQDAEAEVLRKWMRAKRSMGNDAGIFGILPQKPHVHGPNCNHRNPFTIVSEFLSAEEEHVHGPHCDHGHHPPASSSGSGHIHTDACSHGHGANPSSSGSPHYHNGVPCTHSHHHSPSGGHASSASVQESQLSKGKSKVGLWVAGIAAAVGVGAYLINEYGKSNQKAEGEPKPKDWKARVALAESSETRAL